MPPNSTNGQNGYQNEKSKENVLEPKFIESTDAEEKKPEEPKPVSFFKLYKYASRLDLFLISLGIISALITGATTPLNTLIFGDLINAMTVLGMQIYNMVNSGNFNEEELAKIQSEFLDSVYLFAVYNTALGIVMFAGTYVSITLFNYAAHSQIYRIRGQFLKSVLNQDIAWYDVNQSGEFASRMNEDLTKLEDGLGEKVVMFIHFIASFWGSILLALIMGWQLALVCMTSMPVTFVVVGVVAFITSKLAKKELEAYAKAGSIAEEVFDAVRTVVAFSGQKKEVDRYAQNLGEARKINIKKGFFSGLGFGLLWFFIYAAYALSFWYGVTLVLEHNKLPEDQQIYSVGVMFTVFFSVMMAAMNLGASSPFIETFGIAKGAAAKVFNIIENKPLIDPLANTGEIPTSCDSNISFVNVQFNYPSRSNVKVLQGINFNIKKGETVALVGSSGCGKSTCIQLIQRFYDPDSGSILLDGKNLKNLNINWLRERIGVVGQEPILFGTSIYENIRYGYEDAQMDDIQRAAKAANAHHFIQRLPEGYNTLVGERGAQMSGGQKQRIAIARALVRNPDILLLDEATSALDTASEAKVQSALEKASEGRTTIIVAHRLSTIRNADKIVVLKEGLVVEEGDHKSLMKLKKHYFDLVTLQMGSKERDGELTESKAVMEIEDEDSKHIDIIPENIDDSVVAPPLSIFKIMRWNQTEWPWILVGSIASLFMGAAMPLFSIIFGKIIDVLQEQDEAIVRQETDMYSLYFVLTGILVGVATFLQIWTYGIAGEILTERLRSFAFSHMLKQDVGWFDDKSNGTGTLCARLSTDASAVQGATGQRIGTVVSSLSTLFLSIGIGMFYHWKLGLVALAFAPFLLIASYMEIRWMEQQNLGNAKALEKSTKVAVEAVSNIRTVIALGREKMFHDKYIDLLAPSVKRAKRYTHIRGFVFGIARSLWFFSYAACMAYGGYLVVNEGLPIGDVFIVTQALIMGSVSIANSIAFAPNFHKGMMAAAKIGQLLDRTPKVQDPAELDDRDRKRWESYGTVTFYNTEFYYPSRPSSKILKGLNIGVMQGQKVALVGASGCGKSTCIQLLVRYYDPTDGYVAVDDRIINTVTLENLRAQMGIVSQEPVLFDRTIAENIAYGDNSKEVSQDEIIDAAKKANIHNFVASLPLGYETRLGTKGTQLSGGQKQRVAIARALIRQPKILLLDEATSALDMESEKIVQEALDSASEGRTCITIAHRLSTIVDADVILVINNGQVVEKGTHRELLDHAGLYNYLYTLQTAGVQ